MKFIKNLFKSIKSFNKKEIDVGHTEFHIYNDQHKLIYYCDSDKEFECFRDYDEDGHEIHYRDSNEFEYWKDYDESGNIIHYKDTTGREFWDLYDLNGKLISHLTNK